MNQNMTEILTFKECQHLLKVGKNTLLRGMDFGEKARTAERNNQIGGHKA